MIKCWVSLKICSKINSAAIKPQRHREEKKIIQRDKFLLRMKKKKKIENILYEKSTLFTKCGFINGLSKIMKMDWDFKLNGFI